MTSYAIEYRDMQTAIHRIIIVAGDNQLLAQNIRDDLDESESYIPAEMSENADVLDDIEIDFRDRPTEYNGEPLEYITTSSSGRYAESVDVW